jgi:hypothetical protein
MKTKNYYRLCLFIIALAIPFSLLVVMYGLVPFLYINNLPSALINVGTLMCKHNQGFVHLFEYCANVGLPLGAPSTTNMPFAYLSYFISTVPFVEPQSAGIISGFLFLIVAYTCCYFLMRQLGVQKPVAFFMSYLYLMLPMLSGHMAYQSLMYGFMLIPAYILADIVFFKNVSVVKSYKKIGVLLFGYAFIKTFSLFQDGYSFMIASLATLFVLVWFLYTQFKNWKRIVVGLLIFITAYLVTIALYRAYVPGGASYGVMPIDFFRAQGVDLISTILPPNNLMFSKLLNIGTEWNAYAFFGDGSNVRLNYLGYTLIIAFFMFIFMKVKKTYLVKAIIVAGFVAFLLSLGPSLKFNDAREPVEKSQVRFSDYLMPAEAATLSLHTDIIYKKVPGIKNMRATYRWLVLFQFVLILCAALLLTHLIQRKKYTLVAVLCLFMLLEFFPTVLAKHVYFTDKRHEFELLQNDVLDEMRTVLHAGDKIFFLSGENDFLANYFSGVLNLKTFNVGGDKNLEIAIPRWPEIIQKIRKYENVNENLHLAFQTGLLDKLVIPYFSLRWNAYYWPPAQSTKDEITAKQYAAFDKNDPRFAISDYEWFAIVTLTPTSELQ